MRRLIQWLKDDESRHANLSVRNNAGALHIVLTQKVGTVTTPAAIDISLLRITRLKQYESLDVVTNEIERLIEIIAERVGSC